MEEEEAEQNQEGWLGCHQTEMGGKEPEVEGTASAPVLRWEPVGMLGGQQGGCLLGQEHRVTRKRVKSR